MDRFRYLVVLGSMVVGCQITPAPTPVPTPSPSPTPHTPVAAAVLQPSDVPAELSACRSSGPMASYIASIQTTDAALALQITQQWLALQKAGASDAAISLFAADPAACTAELAASSSIKGAASFVVVFSDPGEADRAWHAGILGFVPPPAGEVVPGLALGAPTGLGISAWTYERSPVRLACWQRSVFVALVVVTNLDANTFKTATAAVDARLN